MNWHSLQTIERVTCATTLCVVILFAVGCASVKSSVVNPGTSQYPAQIRPLVFLNLAVQSDISVPMWSKIYHMKVTNILLENVVTHERVYRTFESNVFLSETKTAPYKVDDATHTVFSPVLITLAPGVYIVKSVGVHSVGSGTSVSGTVSDFPESILKLDIPDKDFVSLGTLVVSLSKEDSSLGDYLGSMISPTIRGVNSSGSLRRLSGLENAFAVRTYPFLKDLNLMPLDNK